MSGMLKIALQVCGVGVGGGICYHTWRIEDRKKTQLQQRPLRPMLGSVDDVTADALNVGDIIVFERDCTKLHLHLAAHCAMTKQLLGDSSCDHVGIVFTDKRTKLPMVLEAVPWQGVFSTPFQERIARGDESRISIVPLKLPSSSGNDKTAKFREKRVKDRINTFAQSAEGTDKVPTQAKDSVGLVLNALLSAKIIDPDPKLHNLEPADFCHSKVGLKEGAYFSKPVPIRDLK